MMTLGLKGLRRPWARAAIYLIYLPVMRTQSAAIVPPKFEVVSVKPCAADQGGRGRNGGAASVSPGRLDLKCRTVTDLIRMAYVDYADGKWTPPGRRVPVLGGPAWINSDRYTIDATAEGAPGQAVMRGPMMRSLLEERFQVKIHHESRDVPVYALTVAKGGPRLQLGQPGKCIPRDPDHPEPPSQMPPGVMLCGVFAPSPAKDGVYMYSTTLAYFCGQLSVLLDRDVVDKTGIAGVFDIHIEAPPVDAQQAEPHDPDPAGGAAGIPAPFAKSSPSDPLGAAIVDALQKVGLKLESARGPGEFLVMERVERPSEN